MKKPPEKYYGWVSATVITVGRIVGAILSLVFALVLYWIIFSMAQPGMPDIINIIPRFVR